jgi:hypothetical protein
MLFGSTISTVLSWSELAPAAGGYQLQPEALPFSSRQRDGRFGSTASASTRSRPCAPGHCHVTHLQSVTVATKHASPVEAFSKLLVKVLL